MGAPLPSGSGSLKTLGFSTVSAPLPPQDQLINNNNVIIDNDNGITTQSASSEVSPAPFTPSLSTFLPDASPSQDDDLSFKSF